MPSTAQGDAIDWGDWWMNVGGFQDERLGGNGERAQAGYVPFPMAGHGKAAVLARLARAWGALRVTLSGVGRVWYSIFMFCLFWGREGAW